jgi:hypothetical protein
MSTEKQIAANRANAALSSGPVTQEGKARSSRNATTHGLFSKIIVLPNESQEDFQTVLDTYVERFGPLDGVELGLIEEMVSAYWRERRAFAMEKDLMLSGMANLPPGDEITRMTDSGTGQGGAAKLHTLHYHQTRLQRVHVRALRQLILMRQLFPKTSDINNEPNSVPSPGTVIDVAPEPATS